MERPSGRIGIICQSDHEVFGTVASELTARGHDVEFLPVGRDLAAATLDALDVLVNKKVRWESIHALEYAHRNDVSTWNGYVPSMLFFNRLSQLSALETAGFEVPAVHATPPGGDYVAKEFLDVKNEPELNGDGDFYQPLLDTDHLDYKYYAVDDGDSVHAAVVVFRSKLYGERAFIRRGDVDEGIQRKLERLLEFTGARGVGVDVVYTDDRPVAIDANPATSFRRTDLTPAITESIAPLVSL
jgi:hypothetical protein